jgi:PadR family transcriptional regulator PadR
MGKGGALGEFEHVVLLALVRLRDRAYGMRIRQEIEKRTGRDVSIGAVYTTLERLEFKGYVSSWMGEPTPERGGKSKRFFRLEAPGMAALSSTEEVLRRMRQGIRIRRTAP